MLIFILICRKGLDRKNRPLFPGRVLLTFVIYGIEVCILLFAIKLNFPKNVVLLRGNHESRNMTETFTFRDEVL